MLTATNLSQVVYIPKEEHDDPHEPPQQQDLEGSTKINHTLYSNGYTIMPTPNSSQKLEYIYQHFQENEKVHDSNPNLATGEIDNTLYPHINNNIEYWLFKDVIDSYYFDSQLKMILYVIKIVTQEHNMYKNIKLLHHAHTPLITLHNMSIIWKIQCSSTQYTLMKWMHHYLLWIPPHHVNIILVLIRQIQTIPWKINPTPYHQGEFISKENINTEMFLIILISNIMILIMVMHSLSQTNVQHFYNKNYKILTGVNIIP